jgi:acyl dehydratase
MFFGYFLSAVTMVAEENGPPVPELARRWTPPGCAPPCAARRHRRLENRAAPAQFAKLTGDSQWIHVDPERAKHGPHGTTVVHGYFTVSMLVPMMNEIFEVGGLAMGINYGLNKVRFPAAAPVGSRIRATMHLRQLTESDRGSMALLNTTVGADGVAKPVCVAELVALLIPDESRKATV